MRIIYAILFSIFIYPQYKFDKANIEDFTVNGNTIVFPKDKIKCLEKKLGKLKSVEHNETVPFIGMQGGEMVENDNISMYSTAKKFCIRYIDLEKSHLILKYKGKYSFSSSTTIDDFKKIFPKSYDLPSYIPGTPSENAVGFTIMVKRKKQKAYLNFAFYYNHLASVSISDSYTRIIN